MRDSQKGLEDPCIPSGAATWEVICVTTKPQRHVKQKLLMRWTQSPSAWHREDLNALKDGGKFLLFRAWALVGLYPLQ